MDCGGGKEGKEGSEGGRVTLMPLIRGESEEGEGWVPKGGKGGFSLWGRGRVRLGICGKRGASESFWS